MSAPAIPYRWNPREASFFCVGMTILPIFWVWWTWLPRFKRWQHMLGLWWTVLWMVLLLLNQQAVAVHLQKVIAFWPSICADVTFCLWLWLAVRAFGMLPLIVLFFAIGGPLVSMWMVERLSSPYITSLQANPPDLQALTALLLPILSHLVLAPLRDALFSYELRSTPGGIRLARTRMRNQ